MTDAFFRIHKLDPLLKRNILKTLSWRLLGSSDTIFWSWIVTGSLSFGFKIGVTELLSKMLLYYGHERIWQNLKLGLLPRSKKNKIIKKINEPYLFKHSGKITREVREMQNRNSSFTIWLTGLSGSGKSTIASELESWIFEQGIMVYILDGDNTRLSINSDLSFSDEDRSENIRRVAEICKLFNDAGIIVIASFISPFIKDRKMAKRLIGDESFIEVFTDSSIETCRKRDTKGLYQLAIDGKLKNFTGISSAYQPPSSPDIHLCTDRISVQDCMTIVKQYLIYNRNINIHLKSENVNY